MDILKKQILLLTQEQQSHIHSIIGDGECSQTLTGVRFNLSKLQPVTVQNIRDYIEALNKESGPTPMFEMAEPVQHARKKVELTKHQAAVKKRLKSRCKQRKVVKPDKSSKIDVSVASEFCDALKTGGEDGLDDDDHEPPVEIEDLLDEYDVQEPVVDGDADEADDRPDELPEANDEECVAVLPPEAGRCSFEVLYDHYHACLKSSGFPC